MMILFFLAMVLLFVAGAIFGRTILFPVIEAGKGKKNSVKFYTGDFFSLTLVLVIPALVFTSLRENSRTPIFLAFFVGGLVLLVAIWCWLRGAIKLSSIGVNHGLKRFVFLGFAMPVAISGCGMGVPLLFFFFIDYLRKGSWLLAILCISAIPILAVVGRLTCKWVVSNPKIDQIGGGSTPSTD